MADEFGELRRLAERLEHIVDGAAIGRIGQKAGEAGKKAALEAATDDLGGDRRFGNMKGGSALDATVDAGGKHVSVNMSGPWRLAEAGRQSSGEIWPHGHPAVRTPQGPRAHSSYGPSRGLSTFSDAANKAQHTVPEAVSDQIDAEIRRALG